ncbi:hypothetical protein D9613_001572 [Agrocybe pediades]|uniref:PEBP-like protein n=1 Tax=Agrocybe pediades TaxID=84607 RepID=A0A8H4R914_9AGAR|nr:hypothetical protein D9613_001572 [Agrocybe pediades]
MFAVRRSVPRSLLNQAARRNASLTASPTASASSPPPAAQGAPATQGRRKRFLEKPRKWNRALPKGVIPAYDLALQLLQKDSQNLSVELADLRQRIAEKEAQYQALNSKRDALSKSKGEEGLAEIEEQMEEMNYELEKMLEKANIIEVQSEINMPSVRWTVNNAMADMSKLSHRYLLEQKWRKDGDLDLLMERIYQMNVVPDVLPILKPTVDLRVAARSRPTVFLKTGRMHDTVEPGVYLRPKQTISPPKLYANVFHTDTRLYTMLLVDPDVPDPENRTFTTFLHWMKPNIPLSATSSLLTDLNTHTTYIPPHPQRKTPYHRYVCLLLPQPSLEPTGYTLVNTMRAGTGVTSRELPIPVVQDTDRLHFDVREFAEAWNLEGANGGGAHMWREVWDEDVSAIYKDILKKEEPVFGQPPKYDVYAEMKTQKKYIL